MQCTRLRYCDFIVYTDEDIHIERIEHDKSLLETNLPKTAHLSHILLELLGHWYSRPPAVENSTPVKSTVTDSATNADNNHGVQESDPNVATRYCYCQEGEHGQMVGCDNGNYPYQWFHLACLNLRSPPKGKIWYCPDCRKLDKFKREANKAKLPV